MKISKKYRIFYPPIGWCLIEEGGYFYKRVQGGSFNYAYVARIKESERKFLNIYFEKNKTPVRIGQWERVKSDIK